MMINYDGDAAVVILMMMMMMMIFPIIIGVRNSWTQCTSLLARHLKTRLSSSSRSTTSTVRKTRQTVDRL